MQNSLFSKLQEIAGAASSLLSTFSSENLDAEEIKSGVAGSGVVGAMTNALKEALTGSSCTLHVGLMGLQAEVKLNMPTATQRQQAAQQVVQPPEKKIHAWDTKCCVCSGRKTFKTRPEAFATCQHLSHLSCMKEWVRHSVVDGARVFCPKNGCVVELEQSEVRQMTTPSQYEMYLESSLRLFVLSDPHLGFCPGGCNEITEVGGAKATECTFCLEEYHEGVKLMEVSGCGHVFHEQCLLDWCRKDSRPITRAGVSTCPLCRNEFQVKSGVKRSEFGRPQRCSLCAKMRV